MDDLTKCELISKVLSIVVRKLGSGELKNNLDSYNEYKKLREKYNIPLTNLEKAKLLHIASQNDMKDNEL
jgi:hypothetical protein